MNDFIVWDKHQNRFTDRYVNIRPDGTLWKLTRSVLVPCKDTRYEVFNYIGKKDINNKKIYADSSIVEFENNYLKSGIWSVCRLKGIFIFDSEKLKYKIELLDNDIYKCLFLQYDEKVYDFKIIDTIQENKLGLIK